MIRLFTLSAGGEAYLNFMGHEFGHPEWIDFPREGNGWSFHYCRRQWSLKDNGFLKYQWLNDFDEDMVKLTKEHRIFDQRMGDLRLHQDKVVVFYRNGLLFAYNFHPSLSVTDLVVTVPQSADYTVALCTDDEKYGGQNLVEHMTYNVREIDGKPSIMLYLPARTAVVLQEVKAEEKPKKKAPAKRSSKKAAETAEAAPAEEKPEKKAPAKRSSKKAAETAEAAPAEAKKPTRRKKAEKAE